MSARRTLGLVLGPMLGVFAGMRLFLHLVDRDIDAVLAGHEVHHLFAGLGLLIPAAFALAFGVPRPRWRAAALVALGLGSGLVLDEVIFLIATDGTNDSYVTPVSLWGAVVLEGLAAALLVGLCVWAGRSPRGE